MSKIWFGRSIGAALARVALSPLAWIYEIGWLTYKALYRTGFKVAARPHYPVVCVGNLTVGGSGKTPLTMHIAALLKEKGRSVVISCSGYGSPSQEKAQLAPEGELDPSIWGDEPAMIRWLCPDIPLIVGRNRVQAAILCQQHYKESVLLLDDGFQHLPLHKDLKIILDEPNNFNTRCLPAGPYREPKTASMRADLVIPLDCPLDVEPAGFLTSLGEPLEKLPSTDIGLLTAIGSPDKFENDMASQGYQVKVKCFLPDHDPLTAGTLLEAFPNDLPIVVTPKDWVKLRKRDDIGSRHIAIAMRKVEFRYAEGVAKWLDERLNEIDA